MLYLKEQKGFGLIMVVLTMALLLTVATSLVLVSNIESQMSQRTRYSAVAYQYADTAIEMALAIVLKDKRSEVFSGISAHTIKEVFQDKGFCDLVTGSGTMYCEKNDSSYTTQFSGKIVPIRWRLYFYSDEAGLNIITNRDRNANTILSVKGVGIYEQGGEALTRAVFATVPEL